MFWIKHKDVAFEFGVTKKKADISVVRVVFERVDQWSRKDLVVAIDWLEVHLSLTEDVEIVFVLLAQKCLVIDLSKTVNKIAFIRAFATILGKTLRQIQSRLSVQLMMFWVNCSYITKNGYNTEMCKIFRPYEVLKEL